MSNSTWSAVLLALICGVARAESGPVDALLLRPGEKVVLRVRQVMPSDGLSPGERLLNSKPTLVAGDRFIAEVLHDACPSGVLVGGTIARIHPPGHFRRPGHVEIVLVQLVEMPAGTTSPRPVRLDRTDRTWQKHGTRWLANLYFGLEGGDIGASIGAQLAQGNIGLIMGGAGIGFLVGLGTAAVARGPDGSLEPGDTFEFTAGSCSYRPLPRTQQMTVYPPQLPAKK